MSLKNLADWNGSEAMMSCACSGKAAACGSDGEPEKKPTACGSACGAPEKPGTKPSSCGSACGAPDKPHDKPSACGAGGK